MVALFTAPLFSQSRSLFYIERNKNRNRVQYAVRLDANCLPKGKKPIYAYWRMLEKGPRVTESVGYFERKAYGIKSQKVVKNQIKMTMQALPKKKVTVSFEKKNGKCLAKASTSINKNQAILSKIYVFAVEGLMLPTVKYIDILGKASGRPVKERIKK